MRLEDSKSEMQLYLPLTSLHIATRYMYCQIRLKENAGKHNY